MESSINDVFSNNLQYYLSKNNVQQKDLADYLGVTQTSVHRWVHGTGFPRLDKIDLICSFFGIARYQLVTERNGLITQRLTEQECNILGKYNELNINGKQKVSEYADLLIASGQYKKGMTLASNL